MRKEKLTKEERKKLSLVLRELDLLPTTTCQILIHTAEGSVSGIEIQRLIF